MRAAQSAAVRAAGAACRQRRGMREREWEAYNYQQRTPNAMIKKQGRFSTFGESPEESLPDWQAQSRGVGSLARHRFERKAHQAVRHAVTGRILGQEVREENPLESRRRFQSEIERTKRLRNAEQARDALLGKRRALEGKRHRDIGDVNNVRRRKASREGPAGRADPWGDAWAARAAAAMPEEEEAAHWRPKRRGHKVPVSIAEALVRRAPVDYDAAETAEVEQSGAVFLHQPMVNKPARNYLVDLQSPRVHNRAVRMANHELQATEFLRTRKNVPDALRPAPYEAGGQLIKKKSHVDCGPFFWKKSKRLQADNTPTSLAHTMNEFFH